nr:right-handed parallel beta-helix repeat-containing protein [Bacteroidota bacterium]
MNLATVTIIVKIILPNKSDNFIKYLITFLIALITGSGMLLAQSSIDTVYIDDDFNANTPGWGVYSFDKINDGIAAVDTFGTVYVFNGNYSENVQIYKTIDLIGESRDSTIVNNAASTESISIQADVDSVTITGFSIKKSGGLGSVLIIESSYNYIGANIINGIGFGWECCHNTIIDNTISDSYRAISYQAFCDSNQIIDNIITNCSLEAFNFDHCDYNTISGNTITNNGNTAINFHACNNNTITGNTISGHSKGLYFPNCMCGGCNNNIIYHNNWINNGIHAWDECSNVWDDGYPSGGNYWDDCTGPDNYSGPNQNMPGGDSIGDNPYQITGGNEIDHYPLMFPVGMAAPAETVFVDDDFNSNTPGWNWDHFASIQDGINGVAFGGTVNVANGTYFENISILKTVSLFGQDRDSTIIDAGGSGNVVSIDADSAFVIEFTIMNSGTSQNGIYLNDAKYCTISGCNIKYCGNNGMSIVNSDHNLISDNKIFFNNSNGGIWLSEADYNSILENEILNNRLGLGVGNSQNNTISGNLIAYNGYFGGIYLNLASNNTYTNNVIANNESIGIDIHYYSSNNTIRNCDIFDNGEYGIKINGCDNNQIYHNYFADNTLGNAYDSGANDWSNGYGNPFDPAEEGGNFWDDYTGFDNFSGSEQNQPGGDGIGDSVCIIPEGNNIDNYPFIHQNGWNANLNLNADFSANRLSVQYGETVRFIDRSEGSPINWAWDFDNDGITDSHQQNPVWKFSESGTYTVSLTINNGSIERNESKTDYITSLNGQIITLNEGWNLVHVPPGIQPDVKNLFYPVDMIIVKSYAGGGIYWPGFNINSLVNLKPGKSYFVLMNSSGSITFPEGN